MRDLHTPLKFLAASLNASFLEEKIIWGGDALSVGTMSDPHTPPLKFLAASLISHFRQSYCFSIGVGMVIFISFSYCNMISTCNSLI